MCQPMVLGTNSLPTGIPNLGCSKEENFIQSKQCYSPAVKIVLWNRSIALQPTCENNMAVEQPSGQLALGPGSSLTRQLWMVRYLQCFSSAMETKSSFFNGKGKCIFPLEDSHREGSPLQVSDWPILMQMRVPNSGRLIGPKGPFLIS